MAGTSLSDVEDLDEDKPTRTPQVAITVSDHQLQGGPAEQRPGGTASKLKANENARKAKFKVL